MIGSVYRIVLAKNKGNIAPRLHSVGCRYSAAFTLPRASNLKHVLRLSYLLASQSLTAVGLYSFLDHTLAT